MMMRLRNMWKKVIAVSLAILLIMGIIPLNAYEVVQAEGTSEAPVITGVSYQKWVGTDGIVALAIELESDSTEVTYTMREKPKEGQTEESEWCEYIEALSINIGEADSFNQEYQIKAKNASGESDIFSVQVNVEKDTTGPTISSVSSPTEGYAQELTYKIQAEDEGVGKSEDSEENKLLYYMGTEETVAEGKWQESNTFKITANGTYYVKVKDSLGNESSQTVVVDKIDTEAPEITEILINEIKQENFLGISIRETAKLTVVAEDNTDGPLQYAASKKSDDAELEWQTSPEFTLNKYFLESDTYYFHVMDSAGNRSVEKKVGFTEDTQGPSVAVVSYTDLDGNDVSQTSERFTAKPVTVTVSAQEQPAGTSSKIAGYAIAESEDASAIKTWEKSSAESYQFVLTDSKPYYVFAKDSLGNISKNWTVQAVNLNDGEPTLKQVTVDNLATGQWTNGDADGNITITFDAVPHTNNPGTVFPVTKYYCDETALAVTDNKVTIAGDFKEHTFQVEDNTEKVSQEKTVRFLFDNVAPVIAEKKDAIHLSIKNDSRVAKVLSTLTFGNFFNKELEITVNAQDAAATEQSGASGIRDITVIFMDSNDNMVYQTPKQTWSDECAKISVPYEELEDFQGTVKVVLTDHAGNRSEVPITTLNSNLKDMNVMQIESAAPGIQSVLPANNQVHRSNYKITYSIAERKGEEKASGLAVVKTSVNGTEVMSQDYTALTKKTMTAQAELLVNAADKKVNGVKIKNWNKGKLIVNVNAYDNAGNATSTSRTYYFDRTAPVIDAFTFHLTQNIDVEKGESGYEAVLDAVTEETYGFYFKKDVQVTVSATDYKHSEEAVASGLKGITVYLQGADGQFYTVTENNGTIRKINAISDAKQIVTKEKISFLVPADFKGQIYAYAEDKVGNTPMNAAYCMDEKVEEDGYVHPHGVIAESSAQHKKSSSIVITAPNTKNTESKKSTYQYSGKAKKDAKMDYDTSKNVPLYAEDVNFALKVADTYSGIRQVKYTVMEGSNKQEYTVKVDNLGNLDGDKKNWKVTKESGTNLVTALTNKKIAVSGNYNDMVLLVELTDRAGNTSYDYYVFGIDKTKPTIEVMYDNNNGDVASGTSAYFAENRTATIKVTERNFKAADVNVVVTKDGNKQQQTLEWKKQKGTKNQDDTVYTAELVFGEDADYQFAVTYSDRAGNKSSKVNYGDSQAPKAFTVDKTAANISVAFDNNNAQNEKYFNANRTATITIQEHNFDAGRVVVAQTAGINGNAMDVPAVNWSHSGDIHTGVIRYETDGDYTLQVSMDDMAGNAVSTVDYGVSVAANDFTIDKSITKPTISGVENGVAYKDEVSPVVNFSDVNMGTTEIQLLRTRRGERDVDVTAEYMSTSNADGQNGTSIGQNFEKKPENDGIYTLNVRVTDKAGNQEEDTLTFTVNRFGSVYDYNEYLSSVQNQYIQKITEDIVITEYNPNRLVRDTVELQVTKDGTPMKNLKYEISPVVNTTVAVGSSGWYQYDYVLKASNFAADGIYKIVISSTDEAGNNPETTNFEDGEIMFAVDTLPAEITAVTGLENAVINAESQTVTYEVFDAIGLKNVKVYVSDKEVQNIQKFKDGTQYTGSFELTEGAGQSVRIVVEDMAGNITDTSSEDFQPEYEFHEKVTVSTNLWIRFFANKALVAGVVIGVAAVAGIIGFVVYRKRRAKEK